jgi:hypothetical protein
MTEEELANQLKQYQDLKKQDAKIDVASLAIAAIQAHEANVLTAKEKRWGYLVALALPPFGLLYSLKFYFSGKTDGKTAAWMCVGLTVASVVLFLLILKLMLSGSGTNLEQIEQIKPSDIQQLVQ